MKYLSKRRGSGSFALSIAIHVVLIAALFQMVFRYPLGQLMGLSRPEVTQERIEFVAVASQPQNSGVSARAPAGGAAAALQAPSVLPSTLPLPVPPARARAQTAGGVGNGFGVSGSDLATGVVPRQPDGRIALNAGPIVKRPRTAAQDADSILTLAIGIVKDSLEIKARQDAWPRWTKKTKDGEEWGLTKDYIALGKFKIPTALLALTSLNAPQGMSPIEVRSTAFIRRDVLENGERAVTEDEFRKSVKRIRERKERERRQNQLASQRQTGGDQPDR